jgi:transglutaminase-like putative cysteine protease
MSLVYPGPALLGGLALLLALLHSGALAPARRVSALVVIVMGATLSVGTGAATVDTALATVLGLLFALFFASNASPSARHARFVSALILALVALRTTHVAFLPLVLAWGTSWMVATADIGGRGVPWRLLGRTVPLVGLVALSLFWVLPRGDASRSVASTSHVTGIADRVSLGELGPMLEDPAVLLEVRPGRAGLVLPRPLYVRATVLDRFDGRQWRATAPLTALEPDSPQAGFPVVLRQTERPAGVMFSVGWPLSSEVVGVRVDSQGNLRSAATGPLQWTLITQFESPEQSLPDELLARSLQVPELDRRLHTAAAALRGASPEELARATKSWLGDTAVYAKDALDAAVEDPLASFLFEEGRGHCEYFASAAALMLRLRGVPTRLVHGLVSDRPAASDGSVVLRASDAHAWVEYHDGVRWRRLDATPGGGAQLPRVGPMPWDRLTEWWEGEVVAFDGGRQRTVVVGIGRRVGGMAGLRGTSATLAGWLLLTCFAGTVLALVHRVLWPRLAQSLGGRPVPPTGQVARCWLEARASVEARVGCAPARLPPLSAARWLAERDPSGAELLALAWLHYRVVHNAESEELLLAEARQLALRARERATR